VSLPAPTLDRIPFYGILDTGYVSRQDWESKCLALLEGGAGILQLRAKKETNEERRQLLERILPFFSDTSVPLIINDDLELAAAYPNLGLHVGQDDISPREARAKLGPDRIIGLSTHSLIQAQAALCLASQINYFAVGPVFATGTKPDYTPVGLGLVRQVLALQPEIPFFCIGGINRTNLSQVRAAGAQGVVAVSDVLNDADTAAAVKAYRSA